jgi:hypothetical protein
VISAKVQVVTNSNQSRYELHTKWATTCTIGSPKYKNLKLKKKEGKEEFRGNISDSAQPCSLRNYYLGQPLPLGP